jgi:hypothetical protein
LQKIFSLLRKDDKKIPLKHLLAMQLRPEVLKKIPLYFFLLANELKNISKKT